MAQERIRPPKELLERWRKEDEEARRIRRRMADWDFIEKLPPRQKLALLIYIETGDLYLAARVMGTTIDGFNELRIKARVPWIT